MTESASSPWSTSPPIRVLVNPVREIAEIAHNHGALVLLDACQSVGQLEIDVERLQVDGLAATGRKWLRGPRGTGFLFVRPGLESVLRPAVLDLRGATWSQPLSYHIAHDATRFELSEANVAAQLGLKAAVDYLLELGQADVQAAILSKAEYLRRGLNSITGIHLHGDGRVQSGIVSFTLDGVDATEVQQTLWTMGVTVATVDRSTALLDMSARRPPATREGLAPLLRHNRRTRPGGRGHRAHRFHTQPPAGQLAWWTFFNVWFDPFR